MGKLDPRGLAASAAEPVAWRWKWPQDSRWSYGEALPTDRQAAYWGVPMRHDPLYLAPSQSRDAVLEEAAKVADRFTCGACGMDGKAATAIRSLKTGG